MSLYHPIPPLTLAANVEAPLSPTAWRDYGKLLYWIFFFPQALQDYVTPKPAPAAPATDESADDQTTVDPAAAQPPVQATAQQKQAALVRISTLLLPLLTGLLALLTGAGQRWLGDLEWSALVNSGIGSVPLGLLLAGVVFQVNRLQKRPAHSVVLGVATGVVTTLISMFALGEFWDDHFLGMGRALGYGFLSGSGVGILSNLSTTLARNAQAPTQPALVGALASGLLIFVINSYQPSDGYWAINLNQENWLAVLSGMLTFFGGAQLGQRRPLDWLLGKLFLNAQLRNVVTSQQDRQLIKGATIGNSYAPALELLFAPVASAQLPVQPRFPHVTRFPIRQLTDHLATWLEYNWEQGLDNADQFWRYTNQQPLVTDVIHQLIDEAQPDKQVEQIAQFADKFDGPHWTMLFYPPSTKVASKPPKPRSALEAARQRRQKFQQEMQWRELMTPTLYTTTKIQLPTETVPQQTIAGFLHLASYRLDESVAAFQQLPSSDFVKELQGISQNMQKLLNTKNLLTAPTVELVERPKEPKRKATWDALDKFKTLVRYGWLYHQCQNKERREAARDMALYQLREIQKEAEKIPRADRSMILRLVTLWEREFDNWMAANRKPQRMKPVNPFIFLESLRGRPPFVGRDGELKALKVAGSRGSLQPVLLSGLVQSGKSLLVQKAMFEFKDDIVFVTFAIPDPADGVISPKEVLWSMYQNLLRRVQQQPLTRIIFDLNPEAVTEEAVRRICARYTKTTLVFAVDKVERLYPVAPRPTLQKMKITSSAVTGAEALFAFWAKLAAIGNLSFIFISPADTLPDTPFTPTLKKVPVGNLSLKDLLKLLTTPTPEFIPLFAPEAVEYIYELTNGQPYLVQLIAHGVVDRFNQTLDKDEKLEPVFLIEDVNEVVKSDAFQQFSGAYFATLHNELETLNPGSTTILRTIAQDEDGISGAAIEQALAGQYEWAAVESSLAFLAGHHLIRQEQGEWLVVGELLRKAANN
jgi:hypothetical protein